jgi:hypothetical protein
MMSLVGAGFRRVRGGVLALVVLAWWHVDAVAAAGAMSVKVVPRSASGAFPETTLVYLDGEIDPSVPARLAEALDRVDGTIAVWMNSPGGNLYAGMQLGRLIRKHGAWTHIIDPGTLLPGQCYSACSLAFLGGVFRFAGSGARYGVHRASTTGRLDLGEQLTSAIAAYIREMGVDARLLDLWTKAGPDEMYVLSQREAERLGVVDNGRKPPEWSFARSPGGARLQGRQATTDGTGTVFFVCDVKRTVFGADYEAARAGELLTAQGWSHWLTIDGDREMPLKAPEISRDDDVVRLAFTVPPDLVRVARSARRIGHRTKPESDRASAIARGVDVDAKSASLVRSFLGNCLRRQAR